MKCFITISLILFSCACDVHSQPFQPVRTSEVPCLGYDIPIIDGIADEPDWSAPQSTTVFNTDGWSGDEDFSAEFRYCWWYQHMYFFAHITDNVAHHYHWDYEHPEMFDNIELFLDLDTNTVEPAYRENSTVMLRFCRGMDSVQLPGRAARKDYQYVHHNKSGEWTLEVAIPWTSVLPEGMVPEDIQDYVGNSIGFDVIFNDSDNADGIPSVGNRDAQAAWDLDDPDSEEDRTEDSARFDTRAFGYISLTSTDNPSSMPENTDDRENAASIHQIGSVLLITCEATKAELKVYNVQGSLMLSKRLNPGENQISISTLTSGIYIALAGNAAPVKFALP